MSCLNLRIGKKLLPARKAWRDFTSKLQTKLLKLHSPKPTIIKPRHRLSRAPAPLWPSLSLLPPHPSSLRKSRGLTLRRLRHGRHRRRSSLLFVLQKRGPVYVDELFREPDPKMAVAEEQHRLTPAEERKDVAAEEKGSTAVAKMKGPAAATDDMWESVALGSPQTKGIDERAEEFIARFRAEMEMQEAMARGFK